MESYTVIKILTCKNIVVWNWFKTLSRDAM